MLFSKLTIISALAAFAAAQDTDFDFDNIPAECTDVCAQVGSITNGCKNDSNDDSSAVLQCICTANNANSLIPQCEACVRQYNGNDNDDGSDQYRLLTDCAYSTTTTVATGGAGAVQTTAVDTNTVTDTNTVSVTSVIETTSVAVIVTTGSDGLVATTTETDTNTVPAETSNPAAMKTAGAAMGIGALGLALGML
ncbi:hypothetical protein BKA58DRAFT_403532 [Alternaria rosae]|uniref:uncharacterized protein n=1 Tax=Alternaria rosae TaxID=1187941 RepID=UPI001E8D6662|nr:uncharacterized protein BKA58DRAFT_403532 [Alternaria rosae]KAH6866675.1 hypothetical protein BKA58DRAFT_403532 [Alternaria rosae]